MYTIEAIVGVHYAPPVIRIAAVRQMRLAIYVRFFQLPSSPDSESICILTSHFFSAG